MQTTTHPTRDNILSTLRARILENNPGVEKVEDHVNLMDAGLITSLQFISFLMLIEELRDREIPESEVSVERFSSLDAIYQNFFVNP